MINPGLPHPQQNDQKHCPGFTPQPSFQPLDSGLCLGACHPGHPSGPLSQSLQTALPHTRHLPNTRDVALTAIPTAGVLLKGGFAHFWANFALCISFSTLHSSLFLHLTENPLIIPASFKKL